MDQRTVLNTFTRFSTGEIPFDEFEKWVVSHLQEALDSGNSEIVSWMNEADHLLLRLGQGEIDDERFSEGIAAIVRVADTFELSFPSTANVEFGEGSDSRSVFRDADLTGSILEVKLSLLSGSHI